jgi:hypothetical protein
MSKKALGFICTAMHTQGGGGGGSQPCSIWQTAAEAPDSQTDPQRRTPQPPDTLPALQRGWEACYTPTRPHYIPTWPHHTLGTPKQTHTPGSQT